MISRIAPLLAEIARGEGFALSQAKTTVASQAQRQRLAGVVVNRRPNLAREKYDELGPSSTTASLAAWPRRTGASGRTLPSI